MPIKLYLLKKKKKVAVVAKKINLFKVGNKM